MIRPYQLSDLPRIQELREANGFDWQIPDFGASDAICTHVYTDDSGRIVALGGARMLAEVYYVADPSWASPGQREAVFAAIYEQIERDLGIRGIVEAAAWLQISVAKSFSRRLIRKWGWRIVKTASYFGQVRL